MVYLSAPFEAANDNNMDLFHCSFKKNPASACNCSATVLTASTRARVPVTSTRRQLVKFRSRTTAGLRAESTILFSRAVVDIVSRRRGTGREATHCGQHTIYELLSHHTALIFRRTLITRLQCQLPGYADEGSEHVNASHQRFDGM